METLKYNFSNGGAGLSTPPYNENEALEFWSAYDTPSMTNKDDRFINKELEEISKDVNITPDRKEHASFGKLLGAVARAGKPDKSGDGGL